MNITKQEISKIQDALKKQEIELRSQETSNVFQAAFDIAINSVSQEIFKSIQEKLND